MLVTKPVKQKLNQLVGLASAGILSSCALNSAHSNSQDRPTWESFKPASKEELLVLLNRKLEPQEKFKIYQAMCHDNSTTTFGNFQIIKGDTKTAAKIQIDLPSCGNMESESRSLQYSINLNPLNSKFELLEN